MFSCCKTLVDHRATSFKHSNKGPVRLPSRHLLPCLLSKEVAANIAGNLVITIFPYYADAKTFKYVAFHNEDQKWLYQGRTSHSWLTVDPDKNANYTKITSMRTTLAFGPKCWSAWLDRQEAESNRIFLHSYKMDFLCGCSFVTPNVRTLSWEA